MQSVEKQHIYKHERRSDFLSRLFCLQSLSQAQFTDRISLVRLYDANAVKAFRVFRTSASDRDRPAVAYVPFFEVYHLFVTATILISAEGPPYLFVLPIDL